MAAGTPGPELAPPLTLTRTLARTLAQTLTLTLTRYAKRQLEVWSRQFGAVDGLVRAHGAVNGAVDLQPSPSPSRSLSRSPSPNPSPNTNPSPYPNLTAALAKASDDMLRLQAWLPTRIPTVPVSLSLFLSL